MKSGVRHIYNLPFMHTKNYFCNLVSIFLHLKPLSLTIHSHQDNTEISWTLQLTLSVSVIYMLIISYLYVNNNLNNNIWHHKPATQYYILMFQFTFVGSLTLMRHNKLSYSCTLIWIGWFHTFSHNNTYFFHLNTCTREIIRFICHFTKN